MRRRALELIGVAAVFIAVTVLLQLAPTPVAGQAQTDPGQEAATPTPWGDPDLQGIWTTDYEIPLQRPTRYADKDFFTDEERGCFRHQLLLSRPYLILTNELTPIFGNERSCRRNKRQ